MKKLEIHGNTGDSAIYIGEVIHNLEKYIPAKKAIIITDSIVRHYYEKDFPSNRIIEIGTGEKIKNLDTVRDVYGKLMNLGVDRTSFIVGIGGGIVCDIAGFSINRNVSSVISIFLKPCL